jgi:hypothetical protein
MTMGSLISSLAAVLFEVKTIGLRTRVCPYRHSGGRRNPGSFQRLDTDFRRCDETLEHLLGFRVLDRVWVVAKSK